MAEPHEGEDLIRALLVGANATEKGYVGQIREGLTVAAGAQYDTMLAELRRLRGISDLPDALLVSEDDREELATVIRRLAQGHIKNIEAYALSDVLLAAGYRKVAALPTTA